MTTERGRDATSPGELPPSGWKDIAVRVKDEFLEDHVTLTAAGCIEPLARSGKQRLPRCGWWNSRQLPLISRALDCRRFFSAAFKALGQNTVTASSPTPVEK